MLFQGIFCTVAARKSTMAGALKEVRISTRGARAQLKPGLYWRQLDGDIHLGYRRRAAGGVWLVRWYIGSGNYHREAIGLADDIVAEGNWSFEQACKRAREIVAQKRVLSLPSGGELMETVRTAVTCYVERRSDREMSVRPDSRRKSDAASRMQRHVLGDKIANTRLIDLTESALSGWQKRLPASLQLSSRRRTASDLKAALNIAHRQYRKQLPGDFGEIVRFGLATGDEDGVPYNTREPQILSDDQIRAIIAAAKEIDKDGDLWRLVLLLAATGARFSQLQRLTVADVQPDRLRVFVPRSRKGKGKVGGSYAVQVGTDVIDALEPEFAGKSPNDILLSRWRLVQVKAIEWIKDRRGPWLSASEMTRPWKSICAQLALPATIVPYALRHSSIVRGIRAGLPIRLVAALHDTSVAMIERHYARYIVDGLEDLAARAVIPLVEDDTSSERLCAKAA